MAKSKTTAEFKLKLVQEYLDGRGSCKSIARENGIGKATMQKWIFEVRKSRNRGFSAEGRQQAIFR